MPIDAPPVGAASARRQRLMRLRESLGSGARVDVDAVAAAITRRAAFSGELRRRLIESA